MGFLLPLLLGCAKPVEAPEDLDGLVHYLWQRYDDGSDEELRAALANLEPLVAEVQEGTLTDLTAAEADVVPRGDADPADAQGMYLARDVDCALAPLEEILYDLDQKGLYEAATGDDVYERYDRAYTTDFDAYVARTAPQLGWDVTYVPSPSVVAAYTAEVSGGLRYVPEADGVGPLLVARTWMPEPATFEEGENDSFTQDYQVEVYWTRGDATAHVYGMWRELAYLGLTSDDAGVIGLILDGLSDWDDDTEVVCGAGQ